MGFWKRLLLVFHKPKLDTLDHWILLVAVCAPFTNIPQILTVYIDHNTGISLLSWSLYALFNIPLLTHGIIRKDTIVLFNSGMNMLMQISVVVGALLYR